MYGYIIIKREYLLITYTVYLINNGTHLILQITDNSLKMFVFH